MTTPDKRTYLVLETKTGVGRLVKTISVSRAQSYVLADRFTTRVASQDDLILAMQSGIRVEELGEDGKPTTGIPARRADDQQLTEVGTHLPQEA